MIQASKTVRLERLDNSIRKLGQLMELWDNRLQLVRQPKIKRYLDGKLNIIVDLDVVTEKKALHYQAIFKRSIPSIGNGKRSATFIDNSEKRDSSKEYGGDKFLMLVSNIEIMDGSERVIPSTVRLQRANYIDDIFRGAVYVSLFNHCFKVIPILTEWEINIMGAFPIEPNQVTGQEIKSGSQIVDGISDDGGDFARKFFASTDDQNTFLGINVWLDDDTVRVTSSKARDCVLQVRYVAIGPLNL